MALKLDVKDVDNVRAAVEAPLLSSSRDASRQQRGHARTGRSDWEVDAEAGFECLSPCEGRCFARRLRLG
jgi:hypothetical protein